MDDSRGTGAGQKAPKNSNTGTRRNPKRTRKRKRSRYQGPGCMYQFVNMTVSILIAALIGMVIVEVLMLHK